MVAAKKSKTSTIIVLILMVTIPLTWWAWSYIRWYKFRKHEIHSVIINSDDWWGKSVQFSFADGYSFYVPRPQESKFQVGDSVSKISNSTVVTIFRKDSIGNFKYIFSYDTYKWVSLHTTKAFTLLGPDKRTSAKIQSRALVLGWPDPQENHLTFNYTNQKASPTGRTNTSSLQQRKCWGR